MIADRLSDKNVPGCTVRPPSCRRGSTKTRSTHLEICSRVVASSDDNLTTWADSPFLQLRPMTSAHSSKPRRRPHRAVVSTSAKRDLGSKGDSYYNALPETVNGLHKPELIRRQSPWRTTSAPQGTSQLQSSKLLTTMRSTPPPQRHETNPTSLHETQGASLIVRFDVCPTTVLQTKLPERGYTSPTAHWIGSVHSAADGQLQAPRAVATSNGPRAPGSRTSNDLSRGPRGQRQHGC